MGMGNPASKEYILTKRVLYRIISMSGLEKNLLKFSSPTQGLLKKPR